MIKNTHTYTHTTHSLDHIPLLAERKKNNTEKAKPNVHKMENHSIKSHLGVSPRRGSLADFPGRNSGLLAHRPCDPLSTSQIANLLCLFHSPLMTLPYVSENNLLSPHRAVAWSHTEARGLSSQCFRHYDAEEGIRAPAGGQSSHILSKCHLQLSSRPRGLSFLCLLPSTPTSALYASQHSLKVILRLRLFSLRIPSPKHSSPAPYLLKLAVITNDQVAESNPLTRFRPPLTLSSWCTLLRASLASHPVSFLIESWLF